MVRLKGEANGGGRGAKVAKLGAHPMPKQVWYTSLAASPKPGPEKHLCGFSSKGSNSHQGFINKSILGESRTGYPARLPLRSDR